MKLSYKNGVVSVILRVKVMDSTSSTGGAKTGLTSASSGLIISTIADNEATATAYTVAGSTIESITTLGTFAAPTATKCRFKEVDATNHPGLYEIQIADARWAVSSARSVIVTVSGATGAAQVDAEIQLDPVPADVSKWLGVAPNALVAGRVDAIPNSRSSTATAGTSTTLTLDAGASAVDNYYTGSGLLWTSGVNNGVTRVITGYVGSTKVATFAVALPSAADATPTFTVSAIRHNLPGTDGKALVSADAQDLSATLSVNAQKIGGTGQTGRDLGASVLLAASQHVIVDSGTVTTLTNLPAVPTDWLTAAGVKADAVTKIQAGLSTYAGGDTSGTTTLLARLTSGRAGYLDNLNVGGAVASQADVQAVNQSASKHILIQTVGQYERPESGTTTYTVELRTFNALTGAAVNADSTPTIAPVGAISGSLAANLSALTNPATGVYRATYTVSSTDTQEQIRFDGSATIGASPFAISCYSQVVDLVSVTWNSTNASNLTAIFNKLPAANIADETLVLAAISGLNNLSQANIRTAVGLASANLDTQLASVQADTDDIQTRLPAALTAGGNMKSDALKLNGATPNNVAASDIVSSGAIATAAGAVVAVTTTANVTTVNSLAAGVITAASIASNAITAAKVATDAIGAAQLAADAVTEIQAAILTTALTESYAALHAAPTLTQALLAILQKLVERSISGTTETVKKIDGSTTAYTETLNDASTPTAVTRAS